MLVDMECAIPSFLLLGQDSTTGKPDADTVDTRRHREHFNVYYFC